MQLGGDPDLMLRRGLVVESHLLEMEVALGEIDRGRSAMPENRACQS